ncbi:MAG: leucine-rich repeat domain-containing protein [Clostridia bacterium]|nr:leucine-rich repeat domain-containing protein [Clostridia bacterium]
MSFLELKKRALLSDQSNKTRGYLMWEDWEEGDEMRMTAPYPDPAVMQIWTGTRKTTSTTFSQYLIELPAFPCHTFRIETSNSQSGYTGNYYIYMQAYGLYFVLSLEGDFPQKNGAGADLYYRFVPIPRKTPQIGSPTSFSALIFEQISSQNTSWQAYAKNIPASSVYVSQTQPPSHYTEISMLQSFHLGGISFPTAHTTTPFSHMTHDPFFMYEVSETEYYGFTLPKTVQCLSSIIIGEYVYYQENGEQKSVPWHRHKNRPMPDYFIPQQSVKKTSQASSKSPSPHYPITYQPKGDGETILCSGTPVPLSHKLPPLKRIDGDCDVYYDYQITDQGFCGKRAYWYLYDDQVLFISGEGDMYHYAQTGTATPPWEPYRNIIKTIVIGKDITSIGEWAFFMCKQATHIIFASGSALKRIDRGGFGQIGISSVTLPASLQRLGEFAFFSNASLREVRIEEPSQLTEIGEYAFFNDTILERLYLPDSLQMIGRHLISNSPLAVLSVKKDSDAHTYAITNDLPHIVRETQDECLCTFFAGQTSGVDTVEVKIFSSGTLLVDGQGRMKDYQREEEKPWAEYLSQVKEIEIGEGVTYIGRFAFAYIHSLETLQFATNSHLTKIGAGAFWENTNLIQVTFPFSLETIDSCAFGKCTSLCQVFLSERTAFVRDTAFYLCPLRCLLPREPHIPSSQFEQWIGCLVLDGTEEWTAQCDQTFQKEYVLPLEMASETLFCTHFPFDASESLGENMPCIVKWEEGEVVFLLPADEYLHLSDFKAWLASEFEKGTPVTLWFLKDTSLPIIAPQITFIPPYLSGQDVIITVPGEPPPTSSVLYYATRIID